MGEEMKSSDPPEQPAVPQLTQTQHLSMAEIGGFRNAGVGGGALQLHVGL
jgi:hypothetical protein